MEWGVVSVFILAMLLACLPYFAKFREDNRDATNFVLTLVATCLGVFMASSVQRADVMKHEHATAVRLLGSGTMDLEQCAIAVAQTYNNAIDGDTNAVAPFMTLPTPHVFDAIVSDPTVAKYMSQESLTKLLYCRAQAELLASLSSRHDFDRVACAEYYGRQLTNLRRLTWLEIDFLEGRLSADELPRRQEASMVEMVQNDSGPDSWRALVGARRAQVMHSTLVLDPTFEAIIKEVERGKRQKVK